MGKKKQKDTDVELLIDKLKAITSNSSLVNSPYTLYRIEKGIDSKEKLGELLKEVNREYEEVINILKIWQPRPQGLKYFFCISDDLLDALLSNSNYVSPLNLLAVSILLKSSLEFMSRAFEQGHTEMYHQWKDSIFDEALAKKWINIIDDKLNGEREWKGTHPFTMFETEYDKAYEFIMKHDTPDFSNILKRISHYESLHPDNFGRMTSIWPDLRQRLYFHILVSLLPDDKKKAKQLLEQKAASDLKDYPSEVSAFLKKRYGLTLNEFLTEE